MPLDTGKPSFCVAVAAIAAGANRQADSGTGLAERLSELARARAWQVRCVDVCAADEIDEQAAVVLVITSYSIHYTKLYEARDEPVQRQVRRLTNHTTHPADGVRKNRYDKWGDNHGSSPDRLSGPMGSLSRRHHLDRPALP